MNRARCHRSARRCGAVHELASVELTKQSLIHLANGKVDAGSRHGRAREGFEAKHGNNARFHTPVVLFDYVVEVF
jgi:hypothetical protein